MAQIRILQSVPASEADFPERKGVLHVLKTAPLTPKEEGRGTMQEADVVGMQGKAGQSNPCHCRSRNQNRAISFLFSPRAADTHGRRDDRGDPPHRL